MSYKTWFPREVWKVVQLDAMGYSRKELSEMLGRTVGSVSAMLYRYKRGNYKDVG